MTLNEYDSQALTGGQEVFKQMVQERLRQAVRVALISVLEEEVTAFVGALPYERNEQRRDQRNGHYRRDLETSMGQIEDLPVPRTRGGYHTQVFQRSHRRRDELDTAIAQMFVDGVSMAKVGKARRDADWIEAKSHPRSLACFTPWRTSIESGSNAGWQNAMHTRLPMAPTSR